MKTLNNIITIIIKKLIVKNIRLIENAELDFNEPLILLFGKRKQGKTTFLDCIKLLFSSGFPSDFITHGKATAVIKLEIEGGYIMREFARKGKEVKGKPLDFFYNGEKVPRPVEKLAKLINPFQLDQDHLKNMSTAERNKFLLNWFNIDTSELDIKINDKKGYIKDLTEEFNSFGVLDVTEVNKPDIEIIKEELEAVKKENDKLQHDHNKTYEKVNDKYLKEVDELRSFDNKLEKYENRLEEYEKEEIEIKQEIKKLQNDLKNTKESIEKGKKLIKELKENKPKNPVKPILKPPVLKDTTELNNKLIDAEKQQMKYETYLDNKRKLTEKENIADKIKFKEDEIRQLRKEKVALLTTYTEKAGIKGLKFNEDGSFSYNGIHNDNLSTSEIVELGQQLSALSSDVLKLQLIDRGESLDDLIYSFRHKALKDGSIIIITIVGSAPKEIHENTAIYEVKGGKLIKI